MKTHCGTENYMAPEIIYHQSYVGTEVDIFAAAVVLFILVAGHIPFQKASSDDVFYKYIG